MQNAKFSTFPIYFRGAEFFFNSEKTSKIFGKLKTIIYEIVKKSFASRLHEVHEICFQNSYHIIRSIGTLETKNVWIRMI